MLPEGRKNGCGLVGMSCCVWGSVVVLFLFGGYVCRWSFLSLANRVLKYVFIHVFKIMLLRSAKWVCHNAEKLVRPF